MSRALQLTTTFALLFCLAASTAIGEELTAKDYIEYVKPFVGSWKTTVKTDGKVVEGTWMARESRTGTCLTTFGTGDLPPAQSIDGYDPVSKKWTVAAFGADGSYSLSRLVFDNIAKGKQFGKGATGTGETKVNKSDGTTTSETTKLSCLECTKDKMVVLWFERTEDGKSVPDVTFTMERQQQRQRGSRAALDLPAIPGDAPTAHDYVEYFKTFAGSWKMTNEISGIVSTGTWRSRIARTKTCFSNYLQGGEQPSTEGLHGYDPVAKKWTAVSFDADGVFSIGTVKVADMEKGKRLVKGMIGSNESKRFAPDGSTTIVTSDLVCVEHSQDRSVICWVNRKENGTELPDQQWTVERQPERKRSAKRTK